MVVRRVSRRGAARRGKVKEHFRVPQPRRFLKAKPLWLAVFILMFVSIVAIINSQGEGLTGKAIETRVMQGASDSTLKVEVKGIIGLESVEARFSEPVDGSYLIVEKGASKGEGAYSSFIVRSPNREIFREVVLRLKVRESDLKAMGIVPEQLVVQNNENVLAPMLVKKAGGYVYYSVSSYRLGTFVLTK